MEQPAERYLRVFPLIPIILIWVVVGLMLRLSKIIYQSPTDSMEEWFGMYVMAAIGIAGMLRLCFVARAKITPEGISFADFLTGLRWRFIPWQDIRMHEFVIFSIWRTPNLVLYLHDEAKFVSVVLPYTSKKEIHDFVSLAGRYIRKANDGLDEAGSGQTRAPEAATKVEQPSS